MTVVQAALAFVSLAVIVDPVALAPAFAALTVGEPEAQRQRTARVSVLVGFALIGAAGLGGHAALRALGAETALVHVAVGSALAVMGLAMLLGRGGLPAMGGRAPRDPAFFPLAVPLIAGPGAAGAMIVLTGRHAGQPGALLTLYALLGAVAALTYVSFRAADRIAAQLGPRGVALVTRLLGAVLLAAAARFVWQGLRDHGWAGA